MHSFRFLITLATFVVLGNCSEHGLRNTGSDLRGKEPAPDVCSLVGKRDANVRLQAPYAEGLLGTVTEQLPIVSSGSAPPLDIVPLVLSGSSSNRVDLVFFSDGYTQLEYDKFIADAQRLADDVTRNQTFHTVRPLLNFWAAFSPSKESGIGVGGVPKDTVYGLYRDGTELRGVYYSKPEVARAACQSMGTQCNFPILLGNDPYYGGLGGEFTVITSSHLNGPLVLRHELGHSIIGVGEEYDGGWAYFGVNAVHDHSGPIWWQQWLSDKAVTPRIERSAMPLQSYTWTMLNTTTAWSTEFSSSGAYFKYLVKFSISGVPDQHNLKVTLDGIDLGWTPEPNVGLDRWHYDIYGAERLALGAHEINFTLNEPSLGGVAQLCSVEILEFGDETEFISTPSHYSLYPTFSIDNATTYRPTNRDCLMRTVTIPNFCSVCMEGLWISLLGRLGLIEGIVETCQFNANGWRKVVDLSLIPLAQLRTAPIQPKESYTIIWKKDQQVLSEFTNMTRIEVDDEVAVGTYSIEVEFTTEEVRLKDRSLTAKKEYQVVSRCSQLLTAASQF